MDTLRLALVGTVMLALLGGFAGVAVAQEEAADPIEPTAVTGTMIAARDVEDGTIVHETDAARVVEGVEVVDTYEASDPRLSGEMSMTFDSYDYDLQAQRTYLSVRVGRVELANEGGRWVGTADGFWGPTVGCASTVTMHGEGAYEGLTAYLIADCGSDPVTFAGAILPGEMPEPPVGE